MFVLGFDTTMAACSAALYDGATDRILASAHEAMEKGHAEALPVMVRDLLQDSGVDASQLGRIAVTTGPGTFTGQRIGLALAHGMGVALGCEVVGLNTLTATAVPLLASQSDFHVVHQAGGTGKFYHAHFLRGALQGDLAFAERDAVSGNAKGLLIGTGADAWIAASPSRWTRLNGLDLPSAPDFIRYAAALPSHAGYPQPLYLREPDAKPSAAGPAIVIRAVEADDVPDMAKLHAMSFSAGWSEVSLRTMLALPGSGACVVVMAGRVRGFVLYQIAGVEAEILTLCCEPRWRRRGLAVKLLNTVLELLRTLNIMKLHLEVAADNTAADQLYRKLGFSELGRRKGYYTREGTAAVDALLMSVRP